MQAPRTVVALVTAALLVVAAAAPAIAGTDPGKASGALAWYGFKAGVQEPNLRTSVFRVRDGAPGTNTSTGDSGWYYLKKQGVGSMYLKVGCAKVNGEVAKFAGRITRATGGVFTVGNVFVVSVKDSGEDDEIGMKGVVLKPGDGSTWTDALDKACDPKVFKAQRKGVIQWGNIRVRDPR